MNDDLISRQAAIDAIEAYFGDLPIVVHHDTVQLVKTLPAEQPEIMKKILSAGNEGKKVRIYIRGRLFEVRELAQ